MLKHTQASTVVYRVIKSQQLSIVESISNNLVVPTARQVSPDPK